MRTGHSPESSDRDRKNLAKLSQGLIISFLKGRRGTVAQIRDLKIRITGHGSQVVHIHAEALIRILHLTCAKNRREQPCDNIAHPLIASLSLRSC